MRVDVLKIFRLRLARSAALAAFAGLAGCSSDVARFDDGFYTGAVPRQNVGQGAQQQPYPGDVDRMNTGSVRRGFGMPNGGPGGKSGELPQQQQQLYPSPSAKGDVEPRRSSPVRTANVERSMLAPPSGPAGQPVSDAPSYAAAPQRLPEPQSVAAPERQPLPSASSDATSGDMKPGWNNTGNTVTLRNGETVDTLSDRYGVPVKAILSVNGLASAGQARPGQAIIIPAYSYGKSASAARAAAPTQTDDGARQLGAPPSNLKAPAGRKGGASTVIVEAGDSLNGIARRTGVPVADLRSANGLTGDNIRTGQKLVLPNGAAAPSKRVAALEPKPAAPAPVKPLATAPAPAAAAMAPQQPKAYEPPRANATAAAAAVAAPTPAAAAKPATAAAPGPSVADEAKNDVATAAPSSTGIEQFRWPVQGRVVKRFGEKAGARRNDGLNISVPRGTPIKAAENGVVIYAGDGLKEFGNTVLVKHDNGLVTVYGHADDLKVKRGATVRRGEEIATAGMSGETDTPMVHFEVRKDSAPVDPMTFLQ